MVFDFANLFDLLDLPNKGHMNVVFFVAPCIPILALMYITTFILLPTPSKCNDSMAVEML